jgi:DNA polymerase-4
VTASGEPARKILHVDMDAFYASVETLDDPTLLGKPVIVGGTPEGRGVVAACSYEARRFGVHSAMPAGRALRLCPDGVFLRPRMARYVEISEQIFAVFHRYTPLVEPLSIDEAFLDVVGCERLFGPAEAVGRAIKAAIRDEIGLTASVGVAPNKFLAKLASGLEKPDGFVVLTAAGAPARLAVLPVGKLWGVGRVTEQRLERLGVRLVADLLRLPRAELVAELGELADHLLQLAVGRDDRAVVPDREARSIGNETTFAEDIADEETLREVLDHLVEKVAWRLRKQGLVARTVTLKARYGDFTTHTRARSLPQPTDATVVLRDAARELLVSRLGRAGRPLRLIGVTVSQFESGAGAGQAELFGGGEDVRHRELDRILDRVNERFGPVMRRGGPPRRATPGDD